MSNIHTTFSHYLFNCLNIMHSLPPFIRLLPSFHIVHSTTYLSLKMYPQPFTCPPIQPPLSPLSNLLRFPPWSSWPTHQIPPSGFSGLLPKITSVTKRLPSCPFGEKILFTPECDVWCGGVRHAHRCTGGYVLGASESISRPTSIQDRQQTY